MKETHAQKEKLTIKWKAPCDNGDSIRDYTLEMCAINNQGRGRQFFSFAFQFIKTMLKYFTFQAVKSIVAVDCIFCSKEFPSQRMLACHTKVVFNISFILLKFSLGV